MSLMTVDTTSNFSHMSMFDAVKRQFFYKIRIRTGIVWSLIFYQLLFVLINSVFSPESLHDAISSTYLTVNIFQGNNMIGVTFIWAVVVGILLTTRRSKQINDSFITNKLSNHLSNGLAIVFYSFVGGATAFLSDYAMKLFVVVFRGKDVLILNETINVVDFMYGFTVATMYMLILMTIGYFIGECFQVSPAIMIGLVILLYMIAFIEPAFAEFIVDCVLFFTDETNIALFVGKISGLSICLYGLSIVVNRRLEAR